MRRDVIFTLLALTTSLICSVPRAGAGQSFLRGDEENAFKHVSVILAVMEDVRVDTSGPGNFQTTLIPHATVAGSFDCSLHPKLKVSFNAGTITSSVRRAPSHGSTVLAVISTLNPIAIGANGETEIISDSCEFMPKGSALVEVVSMEDPVIDRVLEKIQAARLRAAATTQPSTQPATEPSPTAAEETKRL